jgi:hypothetical protein
MFYGSAELWTGAPDFAINFTEKGKKLTSYSDGVYYSKVRKNKNNRLYILPEEKQLILTEELYQFANLMFCKQANGEDWWLIIPKALDNMASRFEIKANGDIQQLTDIEFSNNYWRVRSDAEFDFSPDGRYLARLIHRSDTIFRDILEVFEFNRCEGTFESIAVDSFILPEFFTHFADVKFSENNQYLYMGYGSVLLQFDMNLANFIKYPDTVGIYDGLIYYGHHPIFDSFWQLPNGKILVSCNEYNPYLHYIEKPNQKGDSCHFIQRAIELPMDSLNPPFGLSLLRLPDFLPFRMGPLEIPCFDGVDQGQIETPIKIFPNPTLKIFSIQCSMPIEQVCIYNMNGNKVMTAELKGMQDHYEFSVEDMEAGVYLVVCLGLRGEIIGVKKLIKI